MSRRGFAAALTGECFTDLLCAPFRCHYPRAIGPGGVVTNVLLMAAFELRDPVAVLVLMEAGDFSIHGVSIAVGLLPRKRLERRFCRSAQNFFIRMESRSVTGAIPSAIRAVPAHDASDVSADG